MAEKTEAAVFGGGCFWCTEAVFQRVNGVTAVMPGYAGGHVKNPTYRAVCGGDTGHAEVIRVEFDPSKISYSDILSIFFATHDPTTLNRQGNDAGTQYRSIILYADDEQKESAESLIRELNASHMYSAPIVTQVEPLSEFYDAEDYHRQYFENNSGQPYC